MLGDDQLHDGQPQPRSRHRPSDIRPEEPIEDPSEVGLGDAGPAIQDLDPCLVEGHLDEGVGGTPLGGVVEQAKQNGAYLQDALKAELKGVPIVGQVRGLGLWQAVDFTDGTTKGAPPPAEVPVAVARRMWELGVLVNPSGTAIEMAPPLIATRADLDEAVAAVARAVTEVARGR